MEKRAAKAGPEFLKVTQEQIAIPHASHGQAGDVNRLTGLEYRVMQVVAFDTMWGGRCRMTNLEIGLALRLDLPMNRIARSISNAISGRRSHGKRTPGLKGKGYLNVFMNTNPREAWQRELEVSRKWVDPKSIKLAETGAEEPTPAATAAITAATLATETELPTAEQREEVFGRLTRVYARAELAAILVKRLRDHLLVLELVDGMIRAHRVNASATPLSDAEGACLKWLREEVIAELQPKAAPEPAAETKTKPAPRVSDPAEIRGLIGQLTAVRDDQTVLEAFADRLVSEFKDKDPDRSRQTYLGIARDVSRGELAQAVVLEAFEDACKPQKKNRGAAFVAEVKRQKARLKATEGAT